MKTACTLLLVASIVGPHDVRGQAGRWVVNDNPTLSIGTREGTGPELFGSIAGAVRLSNGSFIVADGRNRELKLFGSDGRHVKTSGGPGGGPGEFRIIVAMHRCAGDSIYVYDSHQFRIAVYGPDLRYVRNIDLRNLIPSGYPPYDFSCNRNGLLAFLNRSHAAPPREGPLRPNVEINLVDRGGVAVNLGQFPASEMYYQAPAAGPRHLGKRTSIAVGSSSIVIGTADRYEVNEYSRQGVRLRTISERREPIPVTAREIAAYVDDHVVRNPRRNEAATRKYFAELLWPDVYPAYAAVLVDELDNLWIEDFPIPGRASGNWSVFSVGTGAKVATARMPAGFRLLEAGSDFVVGVWRDELDVDYVRVYRIAKRD